LRLKLLEKTSEFTLKNTPRFDIIIYYLQEIL